MGGVGVIVGAVPINVKVLGKIAVLSMQRVFELSRRNTHKSDQQQQKSVHVKKTMVGGIQSPNHVIRFDHSVQSEPDCSAVDGVDYYGDPHCT